ncbi:TetR/AcrR family transcriptional regulator [Nocardiopsis aegyptia]|uniref:TetR/AcrR family transcriptional regulator n=1 Tax=Nocardiopsis aegyptia TaxID=220378 RepID=UPI00366AE3A2
MNRRGPGRVRSEQARAAILDAALTLLSEHGYGGLSVERIAERAGVGKQTIYRWWPSKSAILAECVLDGDGARLVLPLPDSGDIRADLAAWLATAARYLEDPAHLGLARGLAAAAAEDERVGTALYTRLTMAARSALEARFTDAIASGQLRDGLDAALVADALLGTVMYRILTGDATRVPRLDDLVALID